MKHNQTQPADQLRRNLLATLPAFMLAPAALAQQGLINPNTPQKVQSTVKRDIPILPFTLAGAWSDDLGGRSMLKMGAEIAGAITFAGQAATYEGDQRRILLLQIGAAIECITTLSMASGCSFQMVYPQKSQPWFVRMSISLRDGGKIPTERAIAVSNGIWARPSAKGAFDPSWSNPKSIETLFSMMNEFGLGVKWMMDAKNQECANALQVLAKASPELAKQIGAADRWGAGTSIVLVGTASQDKAQGLLAAGRSLQRGALQSFADGFHCDSFVLPPQLLEAAAVTSKEAAGAVQTLVQLFDQEASEPIGVARIGKLINPACNPAPVCVPMIAFS